MTADPATHEELFIRAFIQKDRRDRLLYEVRQKRGDFLRRFSHQALSFLDPRYVIPIPPPNSDPASILKLLKSHGASASCYAISMSGELDGRFLPLPEALE